MQKELKVNMLTKTNKENVFNKIKRFIKHIFLKEKYTCDIHLIKPIETPEPRVTASENQTINNSFTPVQDDQIKILKLQKDYESGKIPKNELSGQQLVELCVLYDEQIEQLKSLIKAKGIKLLKHEITSIQKNT